MARLQQVLESHQRKLYGRHSIGLLLVAAGLVCLLLLVFLRSPRPGTLSGFAVLVEDPPSVEAHVALQPDFKTLDVSISVIVRNRDSLATNSPRAVIVFPGLTLGHEYLLPSSGTPPISERVPMPEGAVTHYPEFGEDRISLQPVEARGRGTALEFTWSHGLSRTGFADYQLLLPLTPLDHNTDTRLKALPTISASMIIPPGFHPSPVSPAPTGLRLLENTSFLYYQHCTNQLPLEVLFDRPILSQTKEFALVLIGALLGIGGTILMEAVLKHRK